MTKPFPRLSTAALALSLSVSSACAVHAQVARSAPTPAPIVDTIPAAKDVPYPGTIDLAIDATDIQRGLFRVTQTVPVPDGTRDLVMLYPLWNPGGHSPENPLPQISDIRFSAGGKALAWRRDPVEVSAFHVTVPDGVKEITAQLIHTSPLKATEGRVVMTPEMLNLQWQNMTLYPAGYFVRQIPVKATVTVPRGWAVHTALDGQTAVGSSAAGDKVRFATAPYDVLVDSPIFAGKYSKVTPLGGNVTFDQLAHKPGDLVLSDKDAGDYRNLVAEAEALFGARHYDHYEFLLALSDELGDIGLEHHRSTEITLHPEDWREFDKTRWDHGYVIPHEFVHSWNGKYRRPADLWTPDYRTPMRNSLLWVYEGQTQFWGYILSARSGTLTKDVALGQWARAAATYAEGQPGRTWRSVADTTNDPITNNRKPLPFDSLSRSEDYYVEGALVWLEADQLIRKGTGGKRGLDDFARAFFGGTDGDYGEVTYTFDDVVSTLNQVYPYDWAGFLTKRILTPGQPAPLAGIEAGGYKLVFKDTLNPYEAARYGKAGSNPLLYSLGMSLDKSGVVSSVVWDSPAFNAGLVEGATIVAVNGDKYDADTLKDAITAAKGSKAPIQLLVERGDRYMTVPIDYHGGLRYPWLEKVGTGETGIDRLLAPKRASARK